MAFRRFGALVAIMFNFSVWAGGKQILEEIIVTAQHVSEVDVADSANVGTVTHEQLEARTVYRPGELLEATPGLIVSQHSGEGKANQYYLRGFNLDHGTDLRTTVDGMLVNERSHSHGQGWTDLNFLIPELATGLEYKKGPYYASEGDFASAGTVSVNYANVLSTGIGSIGVGQNQFKRMLLADSPEVKGGHLLYALEFEHNDGPFVHPDDYRKINGVLRLSRGDVADGFNVTAMGYTAKWNSSDQVAQRAIDSRLISSRFDAIDPTDGGESHRYSLSGAWHLATDAGLAKIDAYIIDYQLNLFSNFTYFLDNPVNGDQFNQPDRRVTTALNASYTRRAPVAGLESATTVGLQIQNDNIHNGLYSTEARQRLSTTREDHIIETSAGVYLENTTHWLERFRSVIGIREDFYRFNVASNYDLNSGHSSGQLVSPKLSLIFGPWAKTDYYVNFGKGFHSNDARGTTITIDPKSGAPAARVTPLVGSKGVEGGVRMAIVADLQTSLSVYRLDFDSELIFQGDAGSTSAGRPSRRTGFELANYYKLYDWLTIDADLAYARARFRDYDPGGERIPGAVEGVASVALAIDHVGPFYGAIGYRYFGPRPLIENNSVRSQSTATINAHIGYKITPRNRVEGDVFNLANRQASAIDYFYTSRLPGEPTAGVNDIHFHPIESRSIRVNFIANF